MSDAPLAPTSPPDGDINRGQSLLAIFWAEIGISIVVVSARFFVRGKMRTLGWDDWTILITLIMFIITLSLCTVLVTYGLGRHFFFIPPEDQFQVIRWNWIVQPFGILTLPFGKISVVVLLIRLMPSTVFWRKWFLWINMILFTIMMVLGAIFSFAQCNPPRALWENVPGAVCWNPEVQANWAVAGSSYSAFLDFVLALFPITIVWNLKLNLRRRIGLCILLGAGVFSGVCASIKTAQSRSLGLRTDVTWALFDLYAWSATEIFINIVCACIPTLKPLYEHISKGIPILPPTKQSYDLGYSSKKEILNSDASKQHSIYDSQSRCGANIEPRTTFKNSAVVDNTISIDRSFAVEVHNHAV